jgi:uncharacterized protein
MNKQETYEAVRNYFEDKPVSKVFAFGSFSRNEANLSSDIDLIIVPEHPVGLFTLGKYIADLEEITKRKIDLATLNSITPEFKKLIQNDLTEVYAA